MKHLTIIILMAVSALAHERDRDDRPMAHTPEPATIVMMGTGLAVMAAWQWRKKRR